MIVNDPSCILKPEAEMVREPLIRLASKYLRSGKSGTGTTATGPIDPVCNFHSRNGALTGKKVDFTISYLKIARLNWKADLSKLRLSQSLGIMVNYVYDESQVLNNIEEYSKTKKCNVTKDFLDVQLNKTNN